MTTTLKMKKSGIGNALGTCACDPATNGVSLVGIGVIVSMAGLVGVWGFACLIIGIAGSGGILSAAQSWLTAIGM
jgi:hypothetical protein